jgi:CBS domain-containing protein
MKMVTPLLVTIMVSKLVADTIAVGVNHQVLHLNPNFHLLEDALSEDHLLVIETLTTHDLCVSEVVVLREHEPIGQIMSLLMSTSFEGYPVVGSHNKLLGFVPRINLANAVARYNPQEGTLLHILNMATAAPDITPWNMPLARAYHHFRSSGLQRLCVVDENNELIGLLTRTDFARLCKHGHEGVEEIRNLINRKHAKIAAGMMPRDGPGGKYCVQESSDESSDDYSCPPSSSRSQSQHPTIEDFHADPVISSVILQSPCGTKLTSLHGDAKASSSSPVFGSPVFGSEECSSKERSAILPQTVFQ